MATGLRTSAKMKQQVLLLCFALLVCSVQFVSSVEDEHKVTDTKPVEGGGPATAPAKETAGSAGANDQHPEKPQVAEADGNSTNCAGNSTNCEKSIGNYLGELYEKGTIKRAFFVLIGITALVVIYFIVRTVKSRRKRSKSKKYGVISMPGNDLEMAPLDADDEEDDVTVFEVNGHK